MGGGGLAKWRGLVGEGISGSERVRVSSLYGGIRICHRNINRMTLHNTICGLVDILIQRNRVDAVAVCQWNIRVTAGAVHVIATTTVTGNANLQNAFPNCNVCKHNRSRQEEIDNVLALLAALATLILADTAITIAHTVRAM